MYAHNIPGITTYTHTHTCVHVLTALWDGAPHAQFSDEEIKRRMTWSRAHMPLIPETRFKSSESKCVIIS